eukprot:gene27040-biopygen17606
MPRGGCSRPRIEAADPARNAGSAASI